MTGRGDGPGAGAAGGLSRHVPVLLAEVCTALDAKRGGAYIDGTFGAGGYTRAILDAHPQNKVVAIDRPGELSYAFKLEHVPVKHEQHVPTQRGQRVIK